MKDSRQTELKQSAADALKVVSDAAAKEIASIANAALEARKLVATNASEATKVLEVKNAGDHDLLVGLGIRLELLQKSFDRQAETDKGFALKEDLIFWRNLLVGGMLVTVFSAVVTRYIK